jgi:uncharacterized repeat protein (TIGR04061 family)
MMAGTTRRQRDADLLDAMFVPARHESFRSNFRTYARLDTSRRAFWHAIFDPCPLLHDIAGSDGLAVFDPFMAWAEEQSINMGWSLHLWLYRWLIDSIYADGLTVPMARSLRAACAARWAISDRTEHAGIVIGQAGDPVWTVGWKCRDLEKGREIEEIELAELPEGPTPDFGHFIVSAFELDTFPGWMPIPR